MEKPFKKMDKGVSPQDKSHRALDLARGLKRFDNGFDLRAMRAAVARIEGGGVVAEALAALEQSLLAAGFLSVDYASLADAESLALLAETPRRAARLLVAARIGTTRLIDNMAVGGKDQT